MRQLSAAGVSRRLEAAGVDGLLRGLAAAERRCLTMRTAPVVISTVTRYYAPIVISTVTRY